MAGYSGKPLIEKLGYKLPDKVLVVNSPAWFGQILDDARILKTSTLPATWAHVFVVSQEELHHFLDQTNLAQIEKAFWVSWPKQASKIPTDITEQTLRDTICNHYGWVDVKVAAVDETWSALKFLRRIR